MKQLKYLSLALVFGAMITVQALAGGNSGSGSGDPSLGKPNTFGLSDSCWKVFLSGLPAADAAKLTADQQTIADNQTKIVDLQNQINTLLKGSSGKDTANRSKVKELDNQIRTLNDASNTAQMEIGGIIKTNGAAFQLVAENCGRPNKGRDTGKGGGPGTGNNGPGDKGVNTRGHFGLGDSCWNVFLSQLSAADAASLAADQLRLRTNGAQIDSLLRLIRTFKGSRDSSVRTQIKAIRAQVDALKQASNAAFKDYASIIRNNAALLESVRKDCAGKPRSAGGGGATPLFTASEIVPNPTAVGGSAKITLTMAEAGDVAITVSNATAMGAPAMEIFKGNIPAGSQEVPLMSRGLSAGVYMVTIQGGNTVVTKKWMIQ
ncbi:MAG: T9SS type A sorting domain-containing protein [bacterium]